MSVRTPSAAVAWAKKQTTGYAGLCLVFVRSAYGIGAKYPSAADAWAHASKRHVTSSLAGVPIGAPVYFHTPATPYGHVAIYLGGRQFRTNYSAKGTVVTATLGAGALAGMTVLGWAEDINGVTIPGLSPAKSKTTATGSAVYYTIKRGDTLSGIAVKYRTSVAKLAALNHIPNPDRIAAGTRIRVK